MFQYKCLNPISQTGLGLFGEEYKQTEELNDADAVLVEFAMWEGEGEYSKKEYPVWVMQALRKFEDILWK